MKTVKAETQIANQFFYILNMLRHLDSVHPTVLNETMGAGLFENRLKMVTLTYVHCTLTVDTYIECADKLLKRSTYG